MKGIASLCIIILITSSELLFGQDINMSSESVAKILCKKWRASYSINNGKREEVTKDDPPFNFEFLKNNTFILTGNSPNEVMRGTWKYDADKKIIKIFFNNGTDDNDFIIVSLQENEFTVLSHAINDRTGKSIEIKSIFIPRL